MFLDYKYLKMLNLNTKNCFGNLYLSIMQITQGIQQYNFTNKINHSSLLLKSIDDVINYIDTRQTISYDNTTQCISDDITISNQIYNFVEYISIFTIFVIILEYLFNFNNTIFVFMYVVCLYIIVQYGIQLLDIWNIKSYHEHIWLGIATISFTVFSNSLKNTKSKGTEFQRYLVYLGCLVANLIYCITLCF